MIRALTMSAITALLFAIRPEFTGPGWMLGHFASSLLLAYMLVMLGDAVAVRAWCMIGGHSGLTIIGNATITSSPAPPDPGTWLLPAARPAVLPVPRPALDPRWYSTTEGE